MTLARVRETGRGWLQARLAIDGAPYEGVTGSSLARTAADGRIRAVGFDLSGVTLQVRADLARASIDSQGFRAVFKDFRSVWTGAFRRPALETSLTLDLTSSATTATVADTTGWPTSGTIHIDTEAITYTNKTPTTFTGLTRGAWGTPAQAHYVSNGESLYYPRVTDAPSGLEGRRARLYVYGPGDDPQGDGTLRWLGVCATDAAYEHGEWSISIDPITRLLSQPIGGDLAEGVPIRGIYYPVSAPLTLFIVNNTTGQQVVVKLTGYFDDQIAFCAALSTAIAAAIAGTGGWSATWTAGSQITAEPVDQRSWQLVYLVGTGAGAVHQIDVGSPSGIYGGARSGSAIDRFGFPTSGAWFEGDASATGVGVGAVIAGHRYYIPVAADVPRAGLGALSPGVVLDPTGTAISPSDPSASPRYLYLGGLVIPSASMAGFLEGEDAPLRVIGVDIPARALLVQSSFRSLGPDTRIRLGRTLAEGSVDTLLSTLYASSPSVANTGAMPFITPIDVQSNGDVAEVLATSAGRLGTGRVFTAFESVELREIVEHELRALGCYQRIAAAGCVEWKKLRVVVDTDSSSAIPITDSDLVGRPRIERAQYGSLSEVLYRYGYNPSDGKFASSMRFRDAQVSNPNRTAQSLEIARRSIPLGRVLTDVGRQEVSVEDVARVAMPMLGLFGGAYDVWTLPLGPRFGGILVGDTVVVTSSRIPSPDGVMGVTNQIGFVTGVTDEIGSGGNVQLEVLVHGQRYAGWAPGIEITGQTNVSGNIWDITCAGVADYVPTADLRDALRTGELVRVTQYDATSPTEVSGTVTSFGSATVVRVTFSGAWVPGASTWILRARQSTAYASSERIASYCYQAEATRKIDYTPTDVNARVFAP